MQLFAQYVGGFFVRFFALLVHSSLQLEKLVVLHVKVRKNVCHDKQQISDVAVKEKTEREKCFDNAAANLQDSKGIQFTPSEQ